MGLFNKKPLSEKELESRILLQWTLEVKEK